MRESEQRKQSSKAKQNKTFPTTAREAPEHQDENRIHKACVLKWDLGSRISVTPPSAGQQKTLVLPHATQCHNTGGAERHLDRAVASNEGKKSKVKGLSQPGDTAVCAHTDFAFIHIEHSFQVLWF